MRQYAVLFERRVQSSTRAKKAQVVTRQTNPIGRSMIEMLGVLAIIGVLSVGGIAGYSKAMTKFKTNQIANQVATIVTNIKTAYAQQTDYDGLDNASAVAIGIIPDELGSAYGSSYLTNPFNGDVEVYANDRWDNTTFIIAYYNLPREACIDLVTKNWGSSSGLIGVGAGNDYNIIEFLEEAVRKDCTSGYHYSDLFVACPGDSIYPLPMSPQYAAQACNCEGNTCNVVWKYY